ncbi:hypothetical protein HW115_02285 [Verrucomicrobiaceae bacterium N1E253]|uniref:Type II secretion system protein n=1 Tax=Oceaniferula marina TaxID=2748318 RepID=A0A851GBX4_9BACT|nr:hypothetical protein [Oceaniferula marina]NWK54422.1 hypothetical protein [Oceaniferula marina]
MRILKKQHRVQHHAAGSMLLEMTVALGLLTAISFFLFKGSLDVMKPRQWVIRQNITDAYLSYEEAYAKRVSFEELTASESNWPVYPDTSSSTVEVGKAPGGDAINGTLIRTRVAGENNIPDSSDSDYATKLALNPAKMETWKLKSHLSYTLNGKTYVKSRTVVRTR